MLFNLHRKGIDSPIDFERTIQSKILTSIAIMYLSLNGFFALYNLIYTKIYDAVILQGLFFAGTLPALYLISRKKFGATKFIIFFFLNIQVFVSSMYVLPGRGAEYFYIIVIILFIILGSSKLQLYGLIILDICLFLTPQIFVHPYPDANYSYINAITIIVTIVIALQYFILIQNRYKEVLKAQKLKLEKLNSEKNDLMSIVAHDLKTPLSQIKGLITILELEGGSLSDSQKQLIQQIKEVTEAQKKQITGYLKAKSIEDSIDEESFEKVCLENTMQRVKQEMLPLSSAKHIELIESYDSNDLMIEGSSEGVYKIFSNLISNAIKYSQPNKEVKVEVKSDARQVLITIQDQGPGFSESDMANVFKKHKVLSAVPTDNESASGLGLYIVKRYVDKMGGWIWLESKEGQGSTFYIKLPRRQSIL